MSSQPPSKKERLPFRIEHLLATLVPLVGAYVEARVRQASEDLERDRGAVEELLAKEREAHRATQAAAAAAVAESRKKAPVRRTTARRVPEAAASARMIVPLLRGPPDSRKKSRPYVRGSRLPRPS